MMVSATISTCTCDAWLTHIFRAFDKHLFCALSCMLHYTFPLVPTPVCAVVDKQDSRLSFPLNEHVYYWVGRYVSAKKSGDGLTYSTGQKAIADVPPEQQPPQVSMCQEYT